MAAVPTRSEFLDHIVGSMFIAVDPPEVIDKALASAAKRTSSTIYPDDATTKEAVFYKTGILLLRHPKGFPMRQANPDQIFIWEDELLNIQRSGTLGLRNT